MKMNFKGIVKKILPYVAVIIFVIVIRCYIFTFIRVNGESMVPTLHNNDIMALNKIGYNFSDISRFDIVVINTGHEYIVKRIIGLPGEKVKYLDNKLYINGKVVDEDFSHKKTEDFSEIKVADGEYFVLGDNRTNSMDSRVFGSFKKNQIEGKTSFVVFPFKRLGRIK